MLFLLYLDLILTISGVSSDIFYFTAAPTDQDVEEGKPLRLQCKVKPSKNIHYSWLRDTELIVPDSRRFLEANSNLQILHADRDLDGGRYQCRAFNQSSKFISASKDAQINVYWMAPRVEIELVTPAEHGDIKMKSEVVLRCVVNASPKVKASNIQWYFQGKRTLPPYMKVENDGTLRISALEHWHSGMYHCRVVHPAGRMHSRPPYMIYINPSTKELDQSLKPQEFIQYVKEGSSVTLTCPEIPGLTDRVYLWGFMSKLGDAHESANKLPNTQTQDRGRKLFIRNVQSEHVLLYTCDISGPPSPGGSPAKPPIFIFQIELAKIYPLKRSQFYPRIEPNKPITVREGKDLTLRFYIDLTPTNTFLADRIPNPPPLINWYKSNSELIPPWNGVGNVSPDRVHALYGRHLVINKANRKDTGTYSIIVSNLAGRVQQTFSVVTTFAPTFSPQQPADISVDEDEKVTLDCKILTMSPHNTSQVIWKKNRVIVSRQTKFARIDPVTGSIIIDRAKPGHSGSYQCLVRTQGFKEDFPNNAFTLTVKGKLKFTHELKTKFLELNDQGRIPCHAEGYGDVSITWKRIDKDGRLIPIKPPNQIDAGTLILQFVQKEHEGKYVCFARSNYRSSEINMTIDIAVGESPKISYISPNQTAREGSRLIFSCTASGQPNPQISWLQKAGSYSEPLTYSGSGAGSDSSGEMRKPEAGLPDLTALRPREPQRREVLRNGSLIIHSAQLADEGEYLCVAANTHKIASQQGVYLRVLTAEEYSNQLSGEGSSTGIMKTIVIVVSCAVAYLGLIIGLTIFCSMSMIKNRKKRAENSKAAENGHLLTRVNGDNFMPSPHGGYQGNGSLPPTGFPLVDSRSHMSSGLSGEAKSSLYTRSHLSGASGSAGLSNPLDRLSYPRKELHTEGMLGKGEFGDVFLARATNIQEGEPQSLVVVKALMSREPAHVHEFHRQIDMFAKLDHDYVVKLLGLCLELEPQFMILDYCDWGDLKQFLRCMRQERANFKIPPLTPAQKITMCSQVAMGMEHLASMRCVHKDLAARNVLLTQDMDLKISSLGLSRDVYAGEYFPLRDRLVPLRWLAPEAILNDDYSVRSDIWSWAVFVFEVFSLAEIPHARMTDHEVIQMAKKRSLQPQAPNNCPTELVGLLQRCWAENPRDRPSFSEISVIMGDLTIDSDV